MTDELDQRNVFFGVPILGFFRHKRRVDSKAETRPIFSAPESDYESHVTFVEKHEPVVRFDVEEAPRPKRSAKELWGILRENVKNETFHIQDWRTKTERVRTRDQEKHFKEMSLPYEFGVLHCVCAWVVYLGISIMAYSFVFEHWTPIEVRLCLLSRMFGVIWIPPYTHCGSLTSSPQSMYFACVSFTTIGYGDLHPTTRGGRIFCCFFALAGVCVLGIALGIVGSKIIEGEVETLEKAEQRMANRVFGIFSRDKNPRTLNRTDSSGSFSYLSELDRPSSLDEEDQPKWKQITSWWRSLCVLLLRYTPALAPLFIGAYFIARYEDWELDETIYYMVVTSTTIGYGDYVPERESTMLFAVFYIPLAVGAMGHFLGTIANFIIEERRKKFDKKLWKHEITMEDLAEMDEDEDGYVTEVEFLVFMLGAMKKVDKELLEQIRQHFRHLDLTNSGTLVRADLELMAKKKLRTARSKLRLSQYKVSH